MIFLESVQQRSRPTILICGHTVLRSMGCSRAVNYTCGERWTATQHVQMIEWYVAEPQTSAAQINQGARRRCDGRLCDTARYLQMLNLSESSACARGQPERATARFRWWQHREGEGCGRACRSDEASPCQIRQLASEGRRARTARRLNLVQEGSKRARGEAERGGVKVANADCLQPSRRRRC